MENYEPTNFGTNSDNSIHIENLLLVVFIVIVIGVKMWHL